MNPDRPQRIDDLSQLALKRKSGQPVSALAQICNPDSSLRRGVHSLIPSYERHKSFTEISVGQIAADLLEKDYTELVGRTVGAYKILGLLGSGGMGVVYLAQDLRLGRRVALKLLPLQFTGDPNRLRRFEQEARIASALNYPNIVTIHKIGRDAGIHFIVTEYIEGKTLRQEMMERRMSLKEALEVVIQAASALSAAHAVGIIHRDVKPDNIMIRPDGIVKVLDFGLAKLMGHAPAVNDATSTLPAVSTDLGVVQGTTSYMSPEQARGLEIDARTDIWSLGVVLYEVIAGRPPFEGSTKSDVSAAILTKEPLPLHKHSTETPAKLDWIVAKALSKDREERYQTAKELLADLRGLARELEFDANVKHSTPRKTSPRQRVAPTDGGAPTVSIRDEGTLQVSRLKNLLSESKHHKRRAVAFALIMVLGIGFVCYKFLGLNDLQSPARPLAFRPLTSLSGQDREPAFSPDGKQIAFIWNGEKANNFDIYVRVGVGTPLPLSTDPPIDRGPSWSPDGRYIAFFHQCGDNSGFFIEPALGGAAHKLADADPNRCLGGPVEGRSLAWSAEGKFLAVINRSSPQDTLSIFLFSLDTLNRGN